MVVDFVFQVRLIDMDRVIKNPEKSLPEKERKVSEMVRGGGASAYLRRVDKILDALEQQLVSQENLAAIVCEGNLQRACSTCGKEKSVSEGQELKEHPRCCFHQYQVTSSSAVGTLSAHWTYHQRHLLGW